MAPRKALLSACAFLFALPAAAQQDRSWDPRFRGLDRNGDGVVSRGEWSGDRQAYRQHDWNNDGVISGDELTGRRGARDRDATARSAEFGRLDRDNDWRVESYEWPYNQQVFRRLDRDSNGHLTSDEFNNMTEVTLQQLDANRNGRIERSEWPYSFATFRELDQNNDGRLTSQEYFTRGGEYDRTQRFHAWDTNRNGYIESTEWKSQRRLFAMLDRNGDSRLDSAEFQDRARDEFLTDSDRNRDGVISRNEWRGGAQAFRDLDTNNDGVLNADEFFYRGDMYGRQERFTSIDKNNNGVIEGSEWRGNADVFHRLDTNGNSVVDYSEFVAPDPETGFRQSDRYSWQR
jgi:Ca2+-binding EF-hand superfamily protein